MKKRKKSLESHLGAVKICLGEIQDIVDTLGEIPGEKTISIKTEDHEFSSVADLSELIQKRLGTIEIKCKLKDPWVDVNVYVFEKSVYVRADEDSPAIAGAFYKIEKILRGCQLPAIVRFRYWFVIWFPFTTFGLALASYGLGLNQRSMSIAGGSLVGFLLILALIFVTTGSLRQSQVLLIHQSEASTFWKRKKDDLIINIIVLVLGVAGTLFVQWIIKPGPTSDVAPQSSNSPQTPMNNGNR